MRKFALIMLVIIMIITLGACGRRSVETPPPSDNGVNEENGDMIVDPEPEGEEVTLTLYFVNYQYVVTGDESLDRIIPVERTVTAGERPLVEIILTELQTEPEEEELTTTLADIRILSVETAENIAYVNLSSEQLSGGSLQESLLLQQIVYSLMEIEEVEAVQMLVDGSKRETLMGHIFIEEPVTREDIVF